LRHKVSREQKVKVVHIHGAVYDGKVCNRLNDSVAAGRTGPPLRAFRGCSSLPETVTGFFIALTPNNFAFRGLHLWNLKLDKRGVRAYVNVAEGSHSSRKSQGLLYTLN
jgi:hypothetical protein